MKTKKDLTIADYELLGQAYTNLVEAGLVLATVEYDDFIEAVLTGDTFNYDSIIVDRDWHERQAFLREEPLEND